MPPEARPPAAPEPGAPPAGASRRDLSNVPAFLRPRERPTPDAANASAGQRRPIALPRPSTPTFAPAVAAAGGLDPASLPMPSLSLRRLVTVGGVVLAGWLLLSFARQVGEATDAASRADALRLDNAALRADVAQLQEDLQSVQDPAYIQLAGRAYGLGARGEIPFALEAGAPALPPDAPGSAAVRLGAEAEAVRPLDAWLAALFGPES